MCTKAKKLFLFVLSFSLIVIIINSTAYADSWKKDLENELKNIYKLSKYSVIVGGVSKAGSVFEVVKRGLLVAPQKGNGMIINNIINGEVTKPKAAVGLMASLFFGDAKAQRILNVGEKIYITNISVGDDGVAFNIITTEPRSVNVKGNTVSSYDKGAVIFKFSSSPYESTEVKSSIKDFFMLEGVESEPKEISMGQSTVQVGRILGKPEKIFNLGSKTIYSYKDFKVVFIDGKVSDIQ